VVGVVADNKMNALDRSPYPAVYWAIEQMPSANAWVAIRTKADPGSMANAAQAAILALDRDLAITEVQPMPAVMSDSLWRPRFAAVLIAVFAAVAAVLTAAGIYAVFSYLVSRRSQELGVRVALGAGRRDIVALVLGSVLRVTSMGIAAGTAASLLLGRLLTSQFNAVQPNDGALVGGIAGSLLVLAAVSGLWPAIRATGADPLTALRRQ